MNGSSISALLSPSQLGIKDYLHLILGFFLFSSRWLVQLYHWHRYIVQCCMAASLGGRRLHCTEPDLTTNFWVLALAFLLACQPRCSFANLSAICHQYHRIPGVCLVSCRTHLAGRPTCRLNRSKYRPSKPFTRAVQLSTTVSTAPRRGCSHMWFLRNVMPMSTCDP